MLARSIKELPVSGAAKSEPTAELVPIEGTFSDPEAGDELTELAEELFGVDAPNKDRSASKPSPRRLLPEDPAPEVPSEGDAVLGETRSVKPKVGS